MNKVWPFAANFTVYGAAAALIPLLVVHYQGNLGFSGGQIGLLVGLPPIITIFAASFWADLADRTGKVHRIWAGLFVTAIASVVILVATTSFVGVLVALALFNLAAAPTPAFLDTATMHMLGAERDLYGRVRLGGTLGFGLVALLAGVIAERSGIPMSFVVAGVLFVVALGLTIRLEFPPSAAGSGTQTGGVLEILTDRRWWGFLLLATAGGIGFGVSNGYITPHIGALGGSESVMGLATLVASLSEIPVLLFGHRLLRRFRPFHLVAVSVAVASLRFLLFGLAATPGQVITLQLMHGLTFVLLWIAAVAFVDTHAAEGRKATGQGVFGSACLGVGAAIGGLVGGPILTASGAGAVFTWFGIVMALMAGVAVLVPSLSPDRVRDGGVAGSGP